ncbi:N-acetyltransferase 8-like [Hemiscyllium ocellatum]|uniref:N-acetyltransferase 8-like n=1 Tax=Hemiscyllium ocellatum TaxID=170820 RepID=UPI002966DE5C|nr:N-acetyltransferase 8-like [Hemiscyllium ocellatum]XP_060695609.1 N-acetyltransferase 8-like [Hemiscyllium ocellatum]XP_060695611.1 N-acetyltransferase 8-like [Hemiscyllium ocellatum]
MVDCGPSFTIRLYQAGDYQNVRRIVASGTMELVVVAFKQAIRSLSNVCLLFASGQLVYVLTGSLACTSLMCFVLLTFMYLACRQVYASYLRERMETDMADIEGHYLKPPGAGFWVAVEEQGNRVVGTVGVKMEPGYPYSCQLFRLFVDQRFRRHGLGRRLTQKVLDFAKGYGYRVCLLKTTSVQEPAIHMYQKMGFHIQSSSPVPGPALLTLISKISGYDLEKNL